MKGALSLHTSRFNTTVKPLMTDPPEADNLCTVNGSLAPIDELIHFKPPRSGHLSTLNNGHWSAPGVPWPIQNYLQKRTVKLQPHLSITFMTPH